MLITEHLPTSGTLLLVIRTESVSSAGTLHYVFLTDTRVTDVAHVSMVLTVAVCTEPTRDMMVRTDGCSVRTTPFDMLGTDQISANSTHFAVRCTDDIAAHTARHELFVGVIPVTEETATSVLETELPTFVCGRHRIVGTEPSITNEAVVQVLDTRSVATVVTLLGMGNTVVLLVGFTLDETIVSVKLATCTTGLPTENTDCIVGISACLMMARTR